MFLSGLVCERVLGEPVGIPDPPAFAVIVVLLYGIMANVCYTGGWVAELLVKATWREDVGRFGEISFILGLAFSVLLTCLPGALVVAVAGFRLVWHFLGAI
jgi:hypothetical protein